MMPKVDTFEGDISQEIKRKEASLAEISAASNDVGNNDDLELPKKRPMLFITLIVFLILCILGLGGLAYFYFTDPILSPPPGGVPIQQNAIPKSTADIKNISPVLAEQIGRFVTHVEKKDTGYIITINNYSAVFAYMTRNEKEYIEDLGALFASLSVATSTKVNASTTVTTPRPAPQSTSTLSTSSSTKVTQGTASSSQKIDTAGGRIGTSTKISTNTSTTTVTVPLPVEEVVTSYFSDVTISNQNMRVWKNGNRTVVYAFVGNTTIVLSNGTDGVLALKNAILH